MVMYTLDGLTKVKAQTSGLSLHALSSSIEQQDDVQDSLDYLNRIEFPAVICPIDITGVFACDATPKLLSVLGLTGKMREGLVPGAPTAIKDFIASNDKPGYIRFEWTPSPGSTSESLWVYTTNATRWEKISDLVNPVYVLNIEPGLPYSYSVLSINEHGSTISNIDDGQSVAAADPLIKLIPPMLSDAYPEGLIQSSTRYNPNYDAWQAFDRHSTTRWVSFDNVPHGTLDYAFRTVATHVVSSYEITNSSFASSPTTWTVLSSLDGVEWNIIHMVSGLTWETENTKRTYLVDTQLECRYIRLDISATNGGTTEAGIQEFMPYGIRRSDDNPKVALIAPMTNASSNGIATASSEYNTTYSAYKSFEKDSDSQWISSDDALEEWLMYEFPAPTFFTSYSHYSTDGYRINETLKSWRLEGSHDGLVFEVLDEQSLVADWTEYEFREYPVTLPEAFKYYRLVVLKNMWNDGSTPYKVGNLQFWGTKLDNIGEDLIAIESGPSPLITTSSELFGFEGWRAASKDSIQYWLSSSDAVEEWIQYEFDAPTTFDSVAIRGIHDDVHYYSTASLYTIQTSNDGIIWTNTITTTGRDAYPSERLLTQFSPLRAKFIRLLFSANIANDGITSFGIAELLVYFSGVTEYALTPTMTSASVPYGYVRATSTVSYPSEALNHMLDSDNRWLSSSTLRAQIWEYAFLSTVNVTKYRWFNSSASGMSNPDSWRVEVSTNGVEWETVHEITGAQKFYDNWIEYTLATPINANFFRVVGYVPAEGGVMYGIGELEILGEHAPIITVTEDHPYSLVPFMLDNTTPEGIVSSSSTWDTSSEAWRAFSPDNNREWLSSDDASNEWIQYEFVTATTVYSYTLMSIDNHIENSINAWILQGSNDGTAWTDLDTREGQAWFLDERRRYEVAVPASYKFYRVNGTSSQNINGDSPMAINQLDLHTNGSTDSMIRLITSEVHDDLVVSSSNHHWGDTHNAFDKYPGSIWEAQTNVAWLQVEFIDKVETALSYSILSRNSYLGQAPGTWTLEGSTDGATFTVLDTRVGETWDYNGQRKLYIIETPGAYTQYRLNITDSSGRDKVAISDFQLYRD